MTYTTMPPGVPPSHTLEELTKFGEDGAPNKQLPDFPPGTRFHTYVVRDVFRNGRHVGYMVRDRQTRDEHGKPFIVAAFADRRFCWSRSRAKQAATNLADKLNRSATVYWVDYPQWLYERRGFGGFGIWPTFTSKEAA